MRLDRSAFKQQSFSQADNNRAYWLSRTPEERFAAAWYLICCAWKIDPENPPKLDKKIFSIHKHG